MSNKFFKKNKKGFTLLEVIVAVFIISVGVGGTIKIMPSLISGVSHNQSQLIAAYLAQEGMEIVRNIRDTNFLEAHNSGSSTPLWGDGLSSCSSGCEADYTKTTQLAPSLTAFGTGRYLNLDSNGFYSYNSGTATKFKRKITITPGTDILNVLVEVIWEEKGKTYTFPVQENIYKWY